MRKLDLNSNEEAITQIVELASGVSRETIRSTNRVSKVAIARSILGHLLRKEGCSAARAGELVGRHHSSVLKYSSDHENNLKHYDKYNAMYLEVEDEYMTGFRAAKIDVMERQIDELQIAIKKLKIRANKLNINQKQKQWQKNSM